MYTRIHWGKGEVLKCQQSSYCQRTEEKQGEGGAGTSRGPKIALRSPAWKKTLGFSLDRKPPSSLPSLAQVSLASASWPLQGPRNALFQDKEQMRKTHSSPWPSYPDRSFIQFAKVASLPRAGETSKSIEEKPFWQLGCFPMVSKTSHWAECLSPFYYSVTELPPFQLLDKNLSRKCAYTHTHTERSVKKNYSKFGNRRREYWVPFQYNSGCWLVDPPCVGIIWLSSGVYLYLSSID